MFHYCGNTKSTGNGKYNGKYRHNGEQCAICQCRSFIDNTVFGETVDAEINGFDDIVNREFSFGYLIFRDTPDVIGDKFPYICYSFIHGIQ